MFLPMERRAITFEDLPMDVILELALYLEPEDLLALARTSKSLRSIFLSRISRASWRQSMANLGRPGPVPRLTVTSEPEYCHKMVATKRCSLCSSTKLYPVFELGIRHCSAWHSTDFCQGYAIFRRLMTVPPSLYTLVPRLDGGKFRFHDMNMITHRRQMVLQRWDVINNEPNHTYCKKQLMDVASQYEKLQGDSVALQAFVAKQQARARGMIEQAIDSILWVQGPDKDYTASYQVRRDFIYSNLHRPSYWNRKYEKYLQYDIESWILSEFGMPSGSRFDIMRVFPEIINLARALERRDVLDGNIKEKYQSLVRALPTDECSPMPAWEELDVPTLHIIQEHDHWIMRSSLRPPPPTPAFITAMSTGIVQDLQAGRQGRITRHSRNEELSIFLL
ncbi:hypothetical protein HGRIS_006339 [Hohenbuehelia grisea]|uniref:F-box domain-containing protein n=1 Tax=Hohenbuehelia grisea TaxID=104357 RepID=A0ABR3K1Y2_9AGAR